MRIIKCNQHLFDIFVQPKYIIELTESSKTSISSYISIPEVQTESRTKSQWSCKTKVISPNIASLISSCKLVETCFVCIKIIKSRIIALNKQLYIIVNFTIHQITSAADSVASDKSSRTSLSRRAIQVTTTLRWRTSNNTLHSLSFTESQQDNLIDLFVRKLHVII